MNQFFNELMRRNVIRVGAAYLVASWVVLQIGDVMIDFLGMPDWSGKLLVLILGLGFPIALIFAWAFELTPEGFKLDAEADHSRPAQRVAAKRLNIITITLVVAALTVFSIDRFMRPAGVPPLPPAEVTDVPAIRLDASVAVLPFENISQDATNDPFTIGIHDDLLTQVSKVASLRTISRTSVLQYRDRSKPISQIAAELGVASILEGSLQRAGDVVRINVKLIDAQANRQLWAESYERQLTATNIFAIQGEIVEAIANALQANLSPSEKVQIEKVPTENLEALEFYFLARQLMAQRSSAAMKEAIGYFQQAIALDPDFALAYVGLADSYQLQEDAGSLPRAEMFEKTEKAIDKAFDLDRQLGPAYNSLAGLNTTKGNYAEAELMYEKSLELSPNYSTAYLWYGLLLVDQGRIEEAISMYEKGIERDPLSPQLTESLGSALVYEGRFEEALEQYQKSTEINTTFATSYTYIGNIHWMAGGPIRQAVACQRKSAILDGGDRLAQTYLGLLYLDLGDAESSAVWIGNALQLAPDSLEPQSAMALLEMFRGEEGEALESAQAAQKNSPYYPEARLLQTMALSLLRNHDLGAGQPEVAINRYRASHPELFDDDSPTISFRNYRAAIDLAAVLLQTGDEERAMLLLDKSMTFIESGKVVRLGFDGFGVADVQIHALRGDEAKALAALRQAIDEDWRGFWWFYLKDNPNLESLRDNADFQVMVQEVELFMTDQRSRLEQDDTCHEVS